MCTNWIATVENRELKVFGEGQSPTMKGLLNKHPLLPTTSAQAL